MGTPSAHSPAALPQAALAQAVRRVLAATHGRYRRSGADLPYGNPLAAHGLAMEGYFWRLTEAASGRSVIALIGINRPRTGAPWATVGLASWPDGFLRTAAIADGWADPVGLGARAEGPRISQPTGASARFVADGQRVEVDLGPDARLAFVVTDHRQWPERPFGGSSYFQTVPGLNQYWHPWLLGGRASGEAILGGHTYTFTDAQVYGEKNWGKGGFPDHWWWGQAHGFPEREAAVAFAGGEINVGRLRTTVTGLVVRLPDGEVLRLGNPVTSPVRAQVTDEQWLLEGSGAGVRRAARWSIRVAGHAPLRHAHVLPVPLPNERRNVAGALEHLGGRLEVEVRQGGREIWSGTSELAGLEHGSLARAAAEVARRGLPATAVDARPTERGAGA